MIKRIIQYYLACRKFDLSLKAVRSIKNKEKLYKVEITEKQIKLLEYCAIIGIDEYSAIEKLTNIKKPKLEL